MLVRHRSTQRLAVSIALACLTLVVLGMTLGGDAVRHAHDASTAGGARATTAMTATTWFSLAARLTAPALAPVGARLDGSLASASLAIAAGGAVCAIGLYVVVLVGARTLATARRRREPHCSHCA